MALREVGRRTIKGFGIIQIPLLFSPTEGNNRKWTRVEVWAITRKAPSSAFFNFQWRPGKSFYSRITLASDAILGNPNPGILEDILQTYLIQRVYQWEDNSFVNSSLLACATEKILLSIQSLGQSLGSPPISFVGMPIIPRRVCPLLTVRVACQNDAIVDILVLAEDALRQLDPEDAVCGQFQPDGLVDERPDGVNPDNSLDNTPEDPNDDPLPTPAYTPSTDDNGETAPNDTPEQPPGTVGRLVYSGTVQTCQDDAPRPISGPSPFVYPAPLSVRVRARGTCREGLTFSNIEVTGGDGITNEFELTSLVQVPDFTIEYFNP